VNRRLAPPTGQQPPAELDLPGGERAESVPLAEELCTRYAADFPDEPGRYGEHWRAWCVHDNRWILAWAVLDVAGRGVDLAREMAWLTSVLVHRGFPFERIVRNLELLADVAEERLPALGDEVAARLREVAAGLTAPQTG
jgi:hypothetical protein